MTRRMGHRHRYGHDGEHGQMIVLFAICLVAIVAMAGLLIDGGLAWANRRQAQAAADTAALAAAKNIVSKGDGRGAAFDVAKLNGFGLDTTDCNGALLPGNAGPGVQINNPPSSGPHVGAPANQFVEVITTRKMTTTFSGALGMSCWLVTARAVSQIGPSGVASCSFCALNTSKSKHTLLLRSGAHLRVDGDIYVNSSNGSAGPNEFNVDGTCTATWDNTRDRVCGDGFDLFGTAPYISAKDISTVGGWEQQGDNGTATTIADVYAKVGGNDCPVHTQTKHQTQAPKVCIRMPVITDPLNDPAHPENRIDPPNINSMSVPTVGGACPAGSTVPTGSPATLPTITSSTTICPGIYNRGITVTSGTVTMVSGIYYLNGGGLSVTGSGSVDGSAGVMIYNTLGSSSSTLDPGDDLIVAIKPSVPRQYTPKTPTLTVQTTANPKITSKGEINTGQAVVLTFEISKATAPAGAGNPGGTMTFYDGFNPISPGCTNVTMSNGGGGKFTGTCTTSAYPSPGTHYFTALYSGDAITQYNPAQGTFKMSVDSGINISTSGNVKLYGMSSTQYAGLTIFQDRSNGSSINIDTLTGLAACTGSWMTSGVPGSGGSVPGPCGPLGGLRGTIYAPSSGPDCSFADSDTNAAAGCAVVTITASGLADMQIISNEIYITNNAAARFAYTPSQFANGKIRLVE